MTNYIIALYILIGVSITFYWWNTEYAEEYAEAKEEGEAEDSMAIIYMLILTLLWPIRLIYKIIRKIFF